MTNQTTKHKEWAVDIQAYWSHDEIVKIEKEVQKAEFM